MILLHFWGGGREGKWEQVHHFWLLQQCYYTIILFEVVWHTGKVLACGAVGPRFKPRQGQGGFCRAYSVLNQYGTLLQWRGGLFSARTLSFHQMQLASGCMWIWFADSIPALVGFLRALRFPPTPKNRNPFIFLVNSFWSLVVCTNV